MHPLLYKDLICKIILLIIRGLDGNLMMMELSIKLFNGINRLIVKVLFHFNGTGLALLEENKEQALFTLIILILTLAKQLYQAHNKILQL